MRILVMSDGHGAVRDFEKILDKHSDIKHIFYLGDGVEAVAESVKFFTDRIFHLVSGNCDWGQNYPDYDETVLEGVRIIFTHGHRHGVKYTTENLKALADNVGAKLVLYGHTHIAREEYQDGVYIVNPGALKGAREGRESYAIIDLSKAGICVNIIKVVER